MEGAELTDWLDRVDETFYLFGYDEGLTVEEWMEGSE
jgi:hypothetical protein